jgi:hypothetical protein
MLRKQDSGKQNTKNNLQFHLRSQLNNSKAQNFWLNNNTIATECIKRETSNQQALQGLHPCIPPHPKFTAKL